jgi:hypothetical protein
MVGDIDYLFYGKVQIPLHKSTGSYISAEFFPGYVCGRPQLIHISLFFQYPQNPLLFFDSPQNSAKD